MDNGIYRELQKEKRWRGIFLEQKNGLSSYEKQISFKRSESQTY